MNTTVFCLLVAGLVIAEFLECVVPYLQDLLRQRRTKAPSQPHPTPPAQAHQANRADVSPRSDFGPGSVITPCAGGKGYTIPSVRLYPSTSLTWRKPARWSGRSAAPSGL